MAKTEDTPETADKLIRKVMWHLERNELNEAMVENERLRRLLERDVVPTLGGLEEHQRRMLACGWCLGVSANNLILAQVKGDG